MRQQDPRPFHITLVSSCLCGFLVAGCGAAPRHEGESFDLGDGHSGAAAVDPSAGGDAEAEWPRRFPESVAPFVPTPQVIVRAMLELAEVRPADTLFDLGCGDGRILILAAETFGAKAVGVELDPEYYRLARDNVERANLQERVQVLFEDLMRVDISRATVVTVFLSPESNRRLRPRLEAMLGKGARVVSHNFEIPGWETAELRRVKDEEGWSHWIYLYRR